MDEATCAPARSETRRPAWAFGRGGWDTHAHVFGPADRFSYVSGRRYTPPDQTTGQYLATLDRLGLAMGVLVQPSVYGADNSALLDGLGAADGRLRGVVEAEARTLSDAQVVAWSALGVCGVRVWWDGKRPGQWLVDLAARLRGTGWHLDVYCTTLDAFSTLAPLVPGLGLPVMIEAMGTPRGTMSVLAPPFQTLLGMLREGAAWVKLSHPYKVDPSGPPYPLALPFARAIVDAAPAQAVWGSDWPHPNIAGPMPNDGELIDLLPSWAGSTAAAEQILIHNPPRFYGAPGASG